MAWYTPEFEPVLAVALAELDDAGRIVVANAGFHALLPQPEREVAARPVAEFIIQPDFASLRKMTPAPDGEIYRGLLTVGDYQGRTRTLRACIWRRGAGIRILAEYDVVEQERLNDLVLKLNQDYADAQLALAQANLQLQQREAQITALSLTDPLTGVGNRRRLDEELTRELSRFQRGRYSLSALMVDIDHFKRINDTYGHDVGDKVLAALGDLLRAETRKNDIVARFGGEEFVVLMPSTDLAQGAVIAERIRSALAGRRVDPLSEGVTLSAGVAQCTLGETASNFMRRIDMALFRAKEEGRNRVVVDQPSTEASSPRKVAINGRRSASERRNPARGLRPDRPQSAD
jgi:two-component system cell cycle response regulator